MNLSLFKDQKFTPLRHKPIFFTSKGFRSIEKVSELDKHKLLSSNMILGNSPFITHGSVAKFYTFELNQPKIGADSCLFLIHNLHSRRKSDF